MRGLILKPLGLILVAAVLTSSATACKRRRQTPAAAQKEAPTEPATMLGAADPRAAVQLTKGFHEVENAGWRWTAREFAASLKAPVSAAQKGATLVLKFNVLDNLISKLGPLTLSAKVGDLVMPVKRYDKAGSFEYRADVPASAFASIDGVALVPIEFALDKSLPPTETDQRELGLVVSMIGFEAK